MFLIVYLLGFDDLFILLRAFRFAAGNNFNPHRCSRLGINGVAVFHAKGYRVLRDQTFKNKF